jgi:hypothetical protein
MPQDNEYLRKLLSVQDSLIESELSSPVEDEKEFQMSIEIDSAFNFINKEITIFRKSKLAIMRESYQFAVSTSISKVKLTVETIEEKYQLIKDIIAKNSNVSPQITMAFREQNEMSEKDMDSLLNDLEELNLIPPEKKKD